MKQLILLLGLFCTLAHATPIKVGLHDSAPWAYRNAQGEITGLDYEIVKTILQREGIEAEFELYSYSRLLKLFSEQKLDIASPVAVPYRVLFIANLILPCWTWWYIKAVIPSKLIACKTSKVKLLSVISKHKKCWGLTSQLSQSKRIIWKKPTGKSSLSY